MKRLVALLITAVAATASAVDLKTYRDNESGTIIGFPTTWEVDTGPKQRFTVFLAFA